MLFLLEQSKKFLIILLCMHLIFQTNAQNSFSKLAVSLSHPSDRNILEDRSQWKEIESERKINYSTFITPDGRTIIHCSKEP